MKIKEIDKKEMLVSNEEDPFQAYNGKKGKYVIVTLTEIIGAISWKDTQRNVIDKYLQDLPNMTKFTSIPNTINKNTPCKERPYSITIAGCDDIYYSRTFKTLKQAKEIFSIMELIQPLKGENFIHIFNFVYSN